MAQLDGMRRFSDNSKTPRAQTSPTFEQLLHGEYSMWPSSPSHSPGKYHDQEECNSPSNRKSVLMKVKERAKKLCHTLSGKKKQGHELRDGNTTPSWGVNLYDEGEDDDEYPEYLGAPMYESELAPAKYKETARQHPLEVPVASEKHVLPCSVKQHESQQQKKERLSNPNKIIAETVSDPTNAIVSKIAGLTVETKAGDSSAFSAVASPRNLSRCPKTREYGTNSPHAWDKGVSVKEYLMQKFEPGEDERALSQVISQAISPRKNPGDLSVVEKMREAVNSFLRTNEPSHSTTNAKNQSSNISVTTTKTNSSSPILHDSTSTTNLNSSSRVPISTTIANSSSRNPTSTTNASSSSRIPVSTNANSSSCKLISTNAREAVEEKNHGRILQTN